MHRLILFSTLLLFTATSFSQTAELTGRIWHISEDQMAGVGKHEPLPEGTTLEFRADGTWTTSAPLRGATTGTWVRSGDGELRMTFGDDAKSRPIKLLVLTTNELRFRFGNVKATYTYTWKAG